MHLAWLLVQLAGYLLAWQAVSAVLLGTTVAPFIVAGYRAVDLLKTRRGSS